MSMYALLRNNPLPSHKEMESAFEGKEARSRFIKIMMRNLFVIYRGCTLSSYLCEPSFLTKVKHFAK